MIPFEALDVLPPPDGTSSDQVRASLRILGDRLDEPRQALALTFFVDATEDLAERRDEVLAFVGEAFGAEAPPTSVVAQPPEGRHVALEASVLATRDAGLRVERRIGDGILHTVVEAPGVRQVHAGGLVGDARADPASRARDAFAKMESVLGREGMTFGHVVRQWGYIEGMLDIRDDLQGYQAFNDVRTLAYARSPFPAGYPAATGIGQAAGGVLLEFVALDAPAARVEPVSSPKQTDAHRYSDGVLVGQSLDGVSGRTAPKFERAKRVARDGAEITFVSGTAAILGERSVAPGDVAAQTRTTAENMAALVAGGKLTSLRAYVKRAEDMPAVRAVCEDAFGPIPALYVQADVCRDELLVELEGALVVPPSVRAEGAEDTP